MAFFLLLIPQGLYCVAFTLLNIYLIFKCIFSGNVDKHSKGYGKQNLTGRVLA
jgi:hypothetical protein